MKATRTMFATLLLCTLHVCLGMPPKRCMYSYRETFVQCLRDTRTDRDCVGALKNAMQYKCRMDPNKYFKYEVNAILNDVMSQCMMKPMLRVVGAFEKRKAECTAERNTLTKKIFEPQFTTQTVTSAPSTTEKREMEKDIKLRASKTTADLFRLCMSDKNRYSASDRKQCENEAKVALENFNGKQPTEQKLKEELQKGMIETTGDYLRECIRNATNLNEKHACHYSLEIKEACTNMRSDGRACDLNDLKKSARQKATNELRGLMEACIESAKDDAEKQLCRSSQLSDFKNIVNE
jgi:hypothetical protein